MSKHEYEEFEVVDRYGARWRYKRAERYSWSWAVDPNDTQREERKTVEVYLDDAPGEFEPRLVAEFPEPAMVGDVTPNTCLNFNLREIPHEAKR